jgi:hypothetical protein
MKTLALIALVLVATVSQAQTIVGVTLQPNVPAVLNKQAAVALDLRADCQLADTNQFVALLVRSFDGVKFETPQPWLSFTNTVTGTNALKFHHPIDSEKFGLPKKVKLLPLIGTNGLKEISAMLPVQDQSWRTTK